MCRMVDGWAEGYVYTAASVRKLAGDSQKDINVHERIDGCVKHSTFKRWHALLDAGRSLCSRVVFMTGRPWTLNLPVAIFSAQWSLGSTYLLRMPAMLSRRTV